MNFTLKGSSKPMHFSSSISTQQNSMTLIGSQGKYYTPRFFNEAVPSQGKPCTGIRHLLGKGK